MENKFEELWRNLRDLLRELAFLRVREMRLLTYGLPENLHLRVQLGIDGPMRELDFKDIVKIMKDAGLNFLWISEAYNSIWLNFEPVEFYDRRQNEN